MQVEELKKLYKANEVVRAICDHMANRSRNQYETGTHRMLYWLSCEGYDFNRREVISAFRHMEEAECGRYVEGRHGYKSRFVWSIQSKLVADAAQGKPTRVDAEADMEEAVSDETIEHSFMLRPDFPVSVELPTDLTKSEAQRLSQFFGALSFED